MSDIAINKTETYLMETALVPHDTPLIQVGDINTGKWATRLSICNGHIYSWIMNNMWFTNFPASQEGMTKFTWSITSRTGPFDPEYAKSFAHNARVGIAGVDEDS
jgi:hypothetical protein